ncbi:MAG: FAD binding domain-containing protein [Acidobacteriaceae bacterium]
MRSIAAEYELVAPGSLTAVLDVLASAPGEWTPIAGGTELMVQVGAGRLQAKKLVSIWNLPELRQIEVQPDVLRLGAGCTYTDLRNHPVVAAEFPLLAKAAGWTGSIANQNRGTLGGNLVNGSPAADSPPSLLAYGAEVEMISVRGHRRVPYTDFHTGYKKTVLAPDELLLAVHLPRVFAGYVQYGRKVGPRNAQAISKIALAGVGRLKDGVVEDVRIGAASMSYAPLRCVRTEVTLRNQPLHAESIAAARAALSAEIHPIDDIRSTAKYRAHVAGNLLEEFLRELQAKGAVQ